MQVCLPTALRDESLTKYGFSWKLEQHADYGNIARHSEGWLGYKTDIECLLDNKSSCCTEINFLSEISIGNTNHIFFNFETRLRPGFNLPR